jgi:hypothetical protein
MHFPMSLWTSCLGRDCLVRDLYGRRKPGRPTSFGRDGCRNGENAECTGRRAFSLFGFGRKPENAASSTLQPIE